MLIPLGLFSVSKFDMSPVSTERRLSNTLLQTLDWKTHSGLIGYCRVYWLLRKVLCGLSLS